MAQTATADYTKTSRHRGRRCADADRHDGERLRARLGEVDGPCIQVSRPADPDVPAADNLLPAVPNSHGKASNQWDGGIGAASMTSELSQGRNRLERATVLLARVSLCHGGAIPCESTIPHEQRALLPPPESPARACFIFAASHILARTVGVDEHGHGGAACTGNEL